MFGRFSGLALIPRIDARLAAAGLLFVIDRVHPHPAEQGNRRFADMGQEEIDRAGNEQGYSLHKSPPRQSRVFLERLMISEKFVIPPQAGTQAPTKWTGVTGFPFPRE